MNVHLWFGNQKDVGGSSITKTCLRSWRTDESDTADEESFRKPRKVHATFGGAAEQVHICRSAAGFLLESYRCPVMSSDNM